MKKLSPSILTADFYSLMETVEQLKDAGVTMLHIDIMDGMFVPSISFGMPVLKSIRSHTDMFLDVHLMVTEPARYIDEFAKCGADGITVHYEACKDVKKTLNKIKSLGLKTGLSINPDTPIEVVHPYLSDVDMILVMGVNPGFGGQKLIPKCVKKVSNLRQFFEENNISADIQIDGGINRSNIRSILDAGANVIVAGSAVVGGNISDNAEFFLREVENTK